MDSEADTQHKKIQATSRRNIFEPALLRLKEITPSDNIINNLAIASGVVEERLSRTPSNQIIFATGSSSVLLPLLLTDSSDISEYISKSNEEDDFHTVKIASKTCLLFTGLAWGRRFYKNSLWVQSDSFVQNEEIRLGVNLFGIVYRPIPDSKRSLLLLDDFVGSGRKSESIEEQIKFYYLNKANPSEEIAFETLGITGREYSDITASKVAIQNEELTDYIIALGHVTKSIVADRYMPLEMRMEGIAEVNRQIAILKGEVV